MTEPSSSKSSFDEASTTPPMSEVLLRGLGMIVTKPRINADVLSGEQTGLTVFIIEIDLSDISFENTADVTRWKTVNAFKDQLGRKLVGCNMPADAEVGLSSSSAVGFNAKTDEEEQAKGYVVLQFMPEYEEIVRFNLQRILPALRYTLPAPRP